MNAVNPTHTSDAVVTGVFANTKDAENAYNALINHGFSSKDISVLMSDETRERFKDQENTSELGNKALEKAGVGSAIGGAAGAIVGAIAALGTVVVLPGLGLVVAGPLLAALTGAGAGGLTGGIIGALVGSGIPQERAEYYENSLKEGGIVLGVTPRSDAEYEVIAQELQRSGGQEIHSRSSIDL
ncbi:hypothetical protein [Siphonobacter sp. SORGH_AS_0500]|uniref:hypothetical protein n=1 Tax=Siphonobacter sp. SORGH_AS_0500 TaxID=1864824 RepID=UPI002858063D|nr:hypothetical protein [Siphonobacter sp. SORGH_AS_0500]MDR6197410.1 hypothetical protein [Siphonobacter sp. SORGH_AS_0500]